MGGGDGGKPWSVAWRCVKKLGTLFNATEASVAGGVDADTDVAATSDDDDDDDGVDNDDAGNSVEDVDGSHSTGCCRKHILCCKSACAYKCKCMSVRVCECVCVCGFIKVISKSVLSLFVCMSL